MKYITTLATLAFLAGTAIAAPAPSCWNVTGNWQNAATTNCKFNSRSPAATPKPFCERPRNANDPACKKCGETKA